MAMVGGSGGDRAGRVLFGDRILGGSGADVILGNAGNDSSRGNGGNDRWWAQGATTRCVGNSSDAQARRRSVSAPRAFKATLVEEVLDGAPGREMSLRRIRDNERVTGLRCVPKKVLPSS